MHAVNGIFFRWAVTHSFAGDRVDDDRAADALCHPQSLLERENIVSIDRAEILDAQIRE